MFAPAKRNLYLSAASAALIAVLLYLPSFDYGFVNWDDYGYVIQNKYLALRWPAFLKWMWGVSYMGNWHPLTWLSLRLDYAFWQLDPRGYHITNVLLHGLNSFLVTLLAWRLLRAASADSAGKALFASALIGSVFAVHPLHIESVAWVSERKDVLYAFFWLLGLNAYLKSAGPGGRKPRRYRLCLLFFALSLMSKPMAVTFPVVLLVLDYYPLGRFGEGGVGVKALLFEKAPFFFLGIAASVATLFAQTEAMMTVDALPVSERLVVAVRAVGFYSVKFFHPAGLIPLYPLPQEISFLSPGSLAAFLFFATVTACCLLLRRAAPWLAALWAYYVVTLLPTLGLVQVGVQGAADRYMYLPMLGPLIGVSALALWAWGRGVRARALAVAAAVLLVSTASLASARHMAVWKDSYTLWTSAINTDPDVSFSHFYMGKTYMMDGRVDDAMRHFDRAVALDPRQGDFYYDRGTAYSEAGRNEEAARDFTSAIRLKYKKAAVYLNRGNAFSALKRYERALEDYNTALTMEPDNAQIYFNRAFVFSETGSLTESNEDYLEAIALDPGMTGAYNNLGINHLKAGEFERAIGYFDEAISFDPAYGNAYFNRARAYESLGDVESAARDYEKAAELGYGREADQYPSINTPPT